MDDEATTEEIAGMQRFAEHYAEKTGTTSLPRPRGAYRPDVGRELHP